MLIELADDSRDVPVDLPARIFTAFYTANGTGTGLARTPSETYSRPPRASDGCVVLANVDLDALGVHLQIGKTAVLISEQIEWTTPAELAGERKDFMETLERWRADWESLDTEKYLRH